MAQLLSNLPIGAKVKFGKHSINGEAALPITWLVVAKNHTGYPSNSVTLLTEKIIDLRSLDAAEPNSTDTSRDSFGNNTYSVSNIDQWLNSSETSWYTSAHSYDQSPSAEHVSHGTQYDSRPGFLSNFTLQERLAILSTSIMAAKYSHTTESLTRGIFLPSATEVGFQHSIEGGASWGYFNNASDRQSTLTAQCYNNTLSNSKPNVESSYWQWWLRSADYTVSHRTMVVSANGVSDYPIAANGDGGVRPAMNISGTQKVSDTTDSNGYYTVIWNSAPPFPTTFNVPTIHGGKSNAISWSNVTDPDGDTVTYQLECSVNGGAYTQIHSGTSTVYAHLVPFGTTSVAYRVKATDTSGESSAYTTSATVTVINNNAPVISGADANLSVKSEGFTGTYKVTDANNNTVTVTESIDGVQIRSLVVTLGTENTYGITGNTWLALPNGSHTLTIRATDGIDSSVRTYTFTKLVDSFTIRNSTPWASATMPNRIMLVVTRNLPSEATFKVEVCNNGYDSVPTWEDATDAVRSGLVHVFSNKVKTSGQWGVLIRVTVNRNGATGACYVSAIGGNFE